MMIENRVGKFLLYGIILLNIYFFVPYMYRSYVIKEKIELAKNKIEDYNRRIDKLEDDFQREKIARDKLQMVKEKEEIYRFINN